MHNYRNMDIHSFISQAIAEGFNVLDFEAFEYPALANFLKRAPNFSEAVKTVKIHEISGSQMLKYTRNDYLKILNLDAAAADDLVQVLEKIRALSAILGPSSAPKSASPNTKKKKTCNRIRKSVKEDTDEGATTNGKEVNAMAKGSIPRTQSRPSKSPKPGHREDSKHAAKVGVAPEALVEAAIPNVSVEPKRCKSGSTVERHVDEPLESCDIAQSSLLENVKDTPTKPPRTSRQKQAPRVQLEAKKSTLKRDNGKATKSPNPISSKEVHAIVAIENALVTPSKLAEKTPPAKSKRVKPALVDNDSKESKGASVTAIKNSTTTPAKNNNTRLAIANSSASSSPEKSVRSTTPKKKPLTTPKPKRVTKTVTRGEVAKKRKVAKAIKREKNVPVLAYTGKREFNIVERCIMASICYEKGGVYFDFVHEIEGDFDVTHLIASTSIQRPTLKTLYALAKCAYILTPSFIFQAENDEKWPNETDHEHPKWPIRSSRMHVSEMMYGFKFFLYGRFRKFNHSDMVALIQLCGAKTTNEISSCTHVIVKQGSSPAILANMELPLDAMVVTEDWITACLENANAKIPPDFEQLAEISYISQNETSLVWKNPKCIYPTISRCSTVDSLNSRAPGRKSL
ncbi:bifunctional BRCT domain/BRCT domain superfamily [Babesia duncani]|uniref:Bifunctional BRCT domain/BRCT domain superfamily n=1 Tax=Babesia duncani TaxID=323732 RepID=A0AAD9PND6_9APIC|nr:bifunctional BRCT domain/BRCT domain superfamily [Babesia duncani]